MNQRNTPRGKIHPPAANLVERSLRTNIPCPLKNFEPKTTIQKDWEVMEKQRSKTILYYNKTGRNRSTFVTGQTIMFQKKPNSSWLPGRVIKIGDS